MTSKSSVGLRDGSRGVRQVGSFKDVGCGLGGDSGQTGYFTDWKLP